MGCCPSKAKPVPVGGAKYEAPKSKDKDANDKANATMRTSGSNAATAGGGADVEKRAKDFIKNIQTRIEEHKQASMTMPDEVRKSIKLALKTSILAGRLNNSELDGLVDDFKCYNYAPGEVMFNTGDVMTHVMVITAGTARQTIDRAKAPGGRAPGHAAWKNTASSTFGASKSGFKDMHRISNLQDPSQVKVVKDVQNTQLPPGSVLGDGMIGGLQTDLITAPAGEKLTFWGIQQEAAREKLQSYAVRAREAKMTLLNSVEVLRVLLDDQKSQLIEPITMQTFNKDEVIFSEGDRGMALYLVNSGSFRVLIGGVERRILDKGTYFGERALMFDEPRSATILAVEESECAVIMRSDLERVFGLSLELVLSWNMRLLALRTSPELVQLSEEQLHALVRASTIIQYKAGTEVNAAGVRCFIVLEGTVQAGGKTLNRGEMYAGSGKLIDPSCAGSGVGKFKTLDKDVRLAVLSDENIAFALNDVDLSAAIEFTEKENACSKVWLFRHISKKQKDKIVNALIAKTYNDDEVVFRAGVVGTRFYVIKEGEVKILIGDRVVRTMGKNDYFGERALIFNEPRSATVLSSADDTVLLSCERHAFEEAVSVDEALKEYLQNRIALQDTNISLNQLKWDEMLGIGSFGMVWLVHHEKSVTKYALKCLVKTECEQQDQVETLIRERSILLENEHPFLLKLVKTFRDRKYVYFLTEYVSGGELYDAIRKLGLLTSAQAQFYTVSLFLALQSLHQRKTLYRDLKPENSLVDQQGYLKLIDFGCAKKLGPEGVTYSVVGTPHYMSPEVILGRGYSYPADIWSIGVCLYEFLCGPLPFANDEEDPLAVIQAVVQDPLLIPPAVRCEKQRSVLREILVRSADRRLGYNGIDKVMEHSFYSDFDVDMLLGRKIEAPWKPDEPAQLDQEIQAMVEERMKMTEEIDTEWEKDF